MSNTKVRSIRGVEVDFDMISVKNEIGAVPEPEDVKYRENIIQSRRRRKNSSKRKIRDMLSQQQINQDAVRKALEKQRKNTEALSPPVEDVSPVVQQNESTEEVDPRTEVAMRRIRKGNSNASKSD